ncbi:alpha/beta hydrolase, partial [Reichenbachiella sp.]
MKVYCLTGLGADTSVFDLLKINHTKVYIEWIPTHPWETMNAYAKRLCDQIDHSEPFVLLGVSFGGMLAVEMNKFIQPRKTILITSSARKSEMPLWIQLVSKIKLNRIIPSFFFGSNPRWLIFFSGVKSERGKKLVTKIVNNSDRKLTKLFVDQVLTWNNEWLPENVERIYANQDKLLIPPKGIDGRFIEN